MWVPDPNPGTGGESGGGNPGESHADGEMVVESRWWPTEHNDIVDDAFYIYCLMSLKVLIYISGMLITQRM